MHWTSVRHIFGLDPDLVLSENNSGRWSSCWPEANHATITRQPTTARRNGIRNHTFRAGYAYSHAKSGSLVAWSGGVEWYSSKQQQRHHSTAIATSTAIA